MNVVTFYLLVAAILASVFVFFKPLKVTVAKPGELAQIELDRFVIHEVTSDGVKTILGGTHAQRFEDRYVVADLNLTDKSDQHIENMRAQNGIYQEPMIYLHKEVRYERDDGIRFESDDVEYNRTSGQIRANGPFVFWQSRDRLDGRDLFYNTISGDITAKAISGNYYLKDKK